MSILKLKTGAPAPVTPVEFFTSICPKTLAVHEAICTKLGGRYAFQLIGEGGGAWTLDFAHARVEDGVREDMATAGADLYLEMSSADFTELLKGTLDVDAAAEQGRLRVDGDVSLFSNLIAVLEPAAPAASTTNGGAR
jgi:hypothetical protein